jgi:hypothetical protein
VTTTSSCANDTQECHARAGLHGRKVGDERRTPCILFMSFQLKISRKSGSVGRTRKLSQGLCAKWTERLRIRGSFLQSRRGCASPLPNV